MTSPAPSAAATHPITVLMVDDQPMLGEAVRRMLAEHKDITFHFCSDGTKAIQEAMRLKPTVILQDLVMPEIDGLTLVKFFKQNPATRDVPMIVLSSREEPKVKYEAFQNGANDYMVKLPDKLEVVARVRYHSRAYITLLERNQAFQELLKSQEALKRDLEDAERYVRSLFPETGDLRGIRADWAYVSSTELGGDAFGYQWLDAEHFAVYLLDVCGHGVGAALLAVAALNVLRSNALSGVNLTEPAAVLAALNERFDMDTQGGKYLTLWYGVYHKPTRTLRYASGGHPPAVLVPPGAPASILAVRPGMVIGGMPGASFDTASTVIAPGSRLYIFSDGVYEVDLPDDRGMMTLETFADELARPDAGAKRKVDAMFEFSRMAHGGRQLDDDFSLIELQFS